MQPLIFSKTQAEVREAAGLAPKLPVWKKIAFGVGAMPYAMCNTVVGFYLSRFLLEVAIVSEIHRTEAYYCYLPSTLTQPPSWIQFTFSS